MLLHWRQAELGQRNNITSLKCLNPKNVSTRFYPFSSSVSISKYFALMITLKNTTSDKIIKLFDVIEMNTFEIWEFINICTNMLMSSLSPKSLIPKSQNSKWERKNSDWGCHYNYIKSLRMTLLPIQPKTFSKLRVSHREVEHGQGEGYQQTIHN